MRTRTESILALDPGLRDLGFAVLEGSKIVVTGVLPLRHLPKEKRASEARRLVRKWLVVHRPVTLVIEKTYAHPVPWLDELHRLARAVGMFAKARGVSVAAYAPQTVRKTLTGNGWATKDEVATALSFRYPALRVYLTQDRKWKVRYWQNMFDAVALAIHHGAQKPPS